MGPPHCILCLGCRRPRWNGSACLLWSLWSAPPHPFLRTTALQATLPMRGRGRTSAGRRHLPLHPSSTCTTSLSMFVVSRTVQCVKPTALAWRPFAAAAMTARAAALSAICWRSRLRWQLRPARHKAPDSVLRPRSRDAAAPVAILISNWCGLQTRARAPRCLLCLLQHHRPRHIRLRRRLPCKDTLHLMLALPRTSRLHAWMSTWARRLFAAVVMQARASNPSAKMGGAGARH